MAPFIIGQEDTPVLSVPFIPTTHWIRALYVLKMVGICLEREQFQHYLI